MTLRTRLIVTAVLIILAAACGIVTATESKSQTWGWTVSLYWWGSSPYLYYDLIVDGRPIPGTARAGQQFGIGAVSNGQTVGIDPHATDTPGVDAASCELYINGNLMVADHAQSGDDRNLICTWTAPAYRIRGV